MFRTIAWATDGVTAAAQQLQQRIGRLGQRPVHREATGPARNEFRDTEGHEGRASAAIRAAWPR